MDLDSLTVGQARSLAAMFGGGAPPAPHPFAGRYVICRCTGAGVHAGVLVSQDGDRAVLRDSRRLWRWWAAKGVSLSDVAVHGLKPGEPSIRLGAPVEIALTGVCETIPCSAAGEGSIRGWE